MAYTCKEAIVDCIKASGAQAMGQLRRECRTQATDYSVLVFLNALIELQQDGLIARDCYWNDLVFDLPGNV